ncbi:MAG TPA: magnesium transporter [Syntrophomonadaceae bacterium]|nr:magnesium transporter [Syntrophomonadaceae bacterium]
MRDIEIYEVNQYIKENKLSELRNRVIMVPVPDLADLLIELEKPNRVVLFRLLPRPLSSGVFAYLKRDDQNELLKALNDEETRHLLSSLRPDDRTNLFEELPGRMTQKLLNLLSTEDLKSVRQLLGYPEESVGRLMTPDYVAIRPNWTVSQAIEHIRVKGRNSETVSIIYIVDEEWKLLDEIRLQKLILAQAEQKIEALMDYNYTKLFAHDDREEAVRMMKRYDVWALPVVDSEGVLIGVVTFDDVMDVAEEEATEDFHKAAAVIPVLTSYRETSVFELYKKRIAWLIALVIFNLITIKILASYEEVLASAIALSFFIPLLIGTGGNTGTQSATLMVRALATDDVALNQWWKIFMKEVSVGVLLGITMGTAGLILGLFRGGFDIALVIGLTMLAIVLVANFIGFSLPFILTRLKLDPAVASNPLISSLADATGLLIYFAIAIWILSL